jgi:Bacterial Ig domain/Bacterial cadherin-like domain
MKSVRPSFVLIVLACGLLPSPVLATDVTLTGSMTFASLDGSAQDEDGLADGTFTVDGNLTVAGTVTCNDDPPLVGAASACPMGFAVSGDLIIEAGGGLFAENLRGGGNGGAITLDVGGDLSLEGPAGALPGAVVSSGRTTTGAGLAGDITATVEGAIALDAGSTVSAAAHGGSAGAIAMTAEGLVEVAGLVASGPSRVLLATRLTGIVLDGGSSGQSGGTIALRSSTSAEPGVRIQPEGVVVSQGRTGGARGVLLEGCGIEVRGLVASVSQQNGPSQVALRSGKAILVDGTDLGNAGPAQGRVRADGTEGGAANYFVDLFADGAIEVFGPAAGPADLYAVSSSPGTQTKRTGGTITAISLSGTLTAGGKAFSAGSSTSGSQGGTIDLQAKGEVDLDGASLRAVGDFTTTTPGRKGGHIAVRSFEESVSWTFGTGDVRPTGTGITASARGTIELTACDGIDTTGSSFPVLGSPVLPFPEENDGVCSPSAPELPDGEPPLPVCNLPPTADPQAVETDEDTLVTITLTGSDPNGDPLTFSIDTPPAHGTLGPLTSPTPTSVQVDYTPELDYTGSDSFVFEVDDGNGGTDTATVDITIDPVDDPPVAVDDSATVSEDSGPTTIDVLANDTDDDGGPKTIASASDPANGTVVVAGDGLSLTYQPDPAYCNDPPGTSPDTFTYTLSPGGDTATVSVTVVCDDDPPTAVADSATVNEDSSNNVIDVLANDTDPDGGPKTIASATDPANGTVVVAGDGLSLSYTPDPNYCNSVSGIPDTFNYTLSPGGSSTTVSVTVTCIDDPPVAVADAATVTEDDPATTIDVLANDTDIDGGPKTIASATDPANGTVVVAGDGLSLTYAPDPDYCNSVSGIPDTFNYTLSPGGSSTTVSVTVTCVDDDPVAVADAATVTEDDPATTIDVLANDTDVDGGPKTIASATDPANGTVVVAGDNLSLSYTPDANYCNSVSGIPDTFNYTLSPGGSSTTVSVTVTCVDDDPVAVADAATVTEDSSNNVIDVLANDTDVDGGPKTIASATDPANGTVTVAGDNLSLSYTPDPNYCNSVSGIPDTFNYTLSPGGSSTTVSVTVTCVDDPPVAVADAATVDEDSGANAIDVLANDTDIDAGPKTVNSVQNPSTAGGTVLITGGGTGVSYAPALNYCNNPPGTTLDTFTYTLNGGSSTTVTITVTCINDAPTVVNESFQLIGNTELRVDMTTGTTPHTSETTGGASAYEGVLDNDGDLEGDTVTVTAIGNGCSDASAPFDCTLSDGAVVHVDANGEFSYTPGPGDTGAGGAGDLGSFTYTVTDQPGFGTPLSANGTVSFTFFERVWYVENDTATAGDAGTSIEPFDTLAEAQSASLANDYIFIYFGDGTATDQSAGIALKSGQHLIGEHAGLSIPVDLNGNGSPTVLHTGTPGSRPLLDDTVGGGPDGVSAIDVIPTEIVGLSLAGNVNAIEWSTNAAFGGSGTLSIRDNVVTGAGAEGIDILLQGTGATNLAFHDNNLTATGTALDVAETGSGSLTITAFHDNVVTGNSAGAGINIVTATFDTTPGAPITAVPGGGTAIGDAGNRIGGAGLTLTNVTGALNFANLASGSLLAGDLDIYTDSGVALSIGGGVGGFDFDVTANAGVLFSNAGPAAVISGADVGLQLSSLTSSNSASTGVSLTNVTGTFSAPSGSSITGAGTTDFEISGGTANVTYGGTITDDVGQLVSVSGTTAGTKTFSGAITDGNDGDGGGISLSSNAGATINFSGGVTLSTGSNPAFAATGGGTINVIDPGVGANTIVTTTATALNVANTTIGSSGLTFESISVDGNDSQPTNGIIVNNTGSTNGLTVTGTGSANSGGTVQDTSGDAILLTSTQKTSLSWMNLTSNLGSGVRGTTLNGFVLQDSSVTNNGDQASPDESGVELVGLTGTSSGGTHPTKIEDTTISNNFEFQVQVTNASGVLTDFQFNNNTVSSTGASGTIGNLVNFLGSGSATMTLNAVGGSYTGNAPATATAVNADTGGGSLTANVSGASFTNNNVAVTVSTALSGNLTFDIHDNPTVTGNRSHGLNLFIADGTTGAISGKFRNNLIGTNGVAGSGSSLGFGIRVQNEAIRAATIEIDGNTVRELTNFAAINVNHGIVGSDFSETMNVTITDNIIDDVDNSRAIIVQQNVGQGTTCANIARNDMSDIAGNVGDGTKIRIRQLAGGTFNVTQKQATGVADSAELDDANSPPFVTNTTTSAQVSASGTFNYNSAACPLP